MADDIRFYETFYGIHTNHAPATFATFINHYQRLVKGYISEGCTTTDSTTDIATNEFLYLHHIKKKYFIEGVITGQITLAASNGTSNVTSFRVSVCKVNENMNKDVLFTTGWVTVNDVIAWNASYSIGDERNYYFEIDAWEKETLEEKDRIFLRVEVNADAHTILMHTNDDEWEDVMVTIPFIL
jgi:hypothetical protein